MWDLPRPGLEPVSPASAGRLSTTAPPGKPLILFLIPPDLCSCFCGSWQLLALSWGTLVLFHLAPVSSSVAGLFPQLVGLRVPKRQKKQKLQSLLRPDLGKSHSNTFITFHWSKQATGQSKLSGKGNRLQLLVRGAAKSLCKGTCRMGGILVLILVNKLPQYL